MAEPTYDARPLDKSGSPLPEPADDVVELTPPPELTPEEKHRQLMLVCPHRQAGGGTGAVADSAVQGSVSCAFLYANF
jgi:hypothetical protein